MKRLLPLALLLLGCQRTVPETLAARLSREDFNFAQWRATLGREPLPPDLIALLDALDAAQKEAPGRTFALAQDAELRQRALRSPELRAKAMQVLGMAAPDGVQLPTMDQLLHTAPGDNCPICRERTRMQNAGNGL